MSAKHKDQNTCCRVVGAENWCAYGAELPRLHLVLSEGVLKPNRSSLLDRLVESGVWQRVPDARERDSLLYANDGDFYTSRLVRLDPKGPYFVRGADGQTWRYSWFAWQDLATVPDLGGMVRVDCFFRGTGNVQWGLFSATLVQSWIDKENLPFAVRGQSVNGFDILNYRVEYTGPHDRIRTAKVYQNCNGLTWGLHFYRQAYEHALRVETWGGACWPDETTAKAVAARYIQDGTTDMCANLATLRARFPDHPVVAKVARLNPEQR